MIVRGEVMRVSWVNTVCIDLVNMYGIYCREYVARACLLYVPVGLVGGLSWLLNIAGTGTWGVGRVAGRWWILFFRCCDDGINDY